MLRARRFVIGGRVQGVGFRAFVYDHAWQQGISGWVRNLADGRVEVMAEGDEEAMETFEAFLRQGPGRARVEDVEVDCLTPTGRATPFFVKG